MEDQVQRAGIMGAMRCSTARGRKLEQLNGMLSTHTLSLIVNPQRRRMLFWTLRQLPKVGLFSMIVHGLSHLLLKKFWAARKHLRQLAIIAASPGAESINKGQTPSSKAAKFSPAPFKKKPHWHQLQEEPTGWRPPPGSLAIIVVVLTSYCSMQLMTLQMQLMAALLRAQSLNDHALWLLTAAKYPVYFAVQGALVTISSYFRECLVLDWRRMVTRRLHGLYFSNMAYYRVISSRRETRVEDPDVRISQEVEAVCSAYSSFVLAACNALFLHLCIRGVRARADEAGMPKMGLTNGSNWAKLLFMQVLPVVHASHVPLLAIASWMDWPDARWVQHLRHMAVSKYQQAITRLQMHIERACMLQGEAYELRLMERRLCDVGYWSHLSSRAWSGLSFAGTLVASDFGVGISPGQIAADLCACLMLADQMQSHHRGGLSPAAVPHRRVADNIGALAAEPQIQILTVGSVMQLFGLLPMLAQAEAGASRVLELFARLSEANEAAVAMQGSDGTLAEGSDAISFEDVSVETPNGQRLVEQLTFKVGLGDALLIVGHNGAGKSSIMRCLCGLWRVPTGRIVRPSNRSKSGTSFELYYLPQKPISVQGSLSDQVTYPTRLPEGLPSPELRRWLRYVDLEHLADRSGADTPASREEDQGPPLDWDALLSLGEQQALAIARLLYHRPRFAILDECTSAVSKGLERRLFELTRELGIACITIAHRPVLKEYHNRMLRLTGRLEHDGRGWQLESLPIGQRLAEPRAGCGDMEEAHTRITRHLHPAGQAEEAELRAPVERRVSEPSRGEGRNQAELMAQVLRRWPSGFRRFAVLLQLGLVDAAGRWRILRRAISMIGLACIRCGLVWEMLTIAGSARRRAFVGDLSGVWSEIFSVMLVHPVLATVEHQFAMQNKALCQELATSSEGVLLRRALGTGLMLRVMRPSDTGTPAIGNPLQRISELGQLFRGQTHGILQKSLPIQLCLFALPTLVGAGGIPALAVLAGGLACVKACQRAAPDRKRVQRRTDELEARFQKLHARVTHFAEAIAFSGGGEHERQLLEPQLDVLIKFRKRSLRQRFLYSWVDGAVAMHIPTVVQRLLSWNFARRNIPAGFVGVSPNVACANLFYDTVVSLAQRAQGVASELIDLYEKMDGRAMRILELVLALEAAAATEATRTTASPGSGARGIAPDGALQVRGLDLVTPGGVCLASQVSFGLEVGAPVLVTGPNGSGKSLLFCTLLGLVPPAGGDVHIEIPGAGLSARPGYRILMAAPQRIYLPLGTLGDQVCYPCCYLPGHASATGEDHEQRMLGALRAAGLEHLLSREEDGWLAECVWEDVLSGGEQQRMALARVFYGRPCFALLDECTSMVASDAEEDLYWALTRAGVTPMTFSQRLFMPTLYRKELSLGAPTPEGWHLTRVGQSPTRAEGCLKGRGLMKWDAQ